MVYFKNHANRMHIVYDIDKIKFLGIEKGCEVADLGAGYGYFSKEFIEIQNHCL